VLLRLEHFYSKGEDAQLSKPAPVQLKGLFATFDGITVRELTLAANADVDALKSRLKFKYTAMGKVEEPADVKTVTGQDFEVQLNPMQIRTFLLQVKRN